MHAITCASSPAPPRSTLKHGSMGSVHVWEGSAARAARSERGRGLPNREGATSGGNTWDCGAAGRRWSQPWLVDRQGDYSRCQGYLQNKWAAYAAGCQMGLNRGPCKFGWLTAAGGTGAGHCLMGACSSPPRDGSRPQ